MPYSAEDFAGLTYALRGKGEQGNRHAKFIQDNFYASKAYSYFAK